MRTTLDLPEELYGNVKSTAERRGESIDETVSKALAAFVTTEGKVWNKGDETVEAPLSPEERELDLQKWREEEAAFLKLMEGPVLDTRSAVEIIREGRR